jgi:hypothetical protein
VGSALGSRFVAAAAIVALATVAGACGEDASDRDASPDGRASSTPSASTTTPPSDPQPVDVVAGRVVRGGSGPCYGVETDDGRLYAVYGTDAGELAVGTTVRVKIGPPTAGVDCGEGEPVTALGVELVG